MRKCRHRHNRLPKGKQERMWRRERQRLGAHKFEEMLHIEIPSFRDFLAERYGIK